MSLVVPGIVFARAARIFESVAVSTACLLYTSFTNRNYAEILNNINVDIGNMTSIADEGVFFVVTQAFSMVGGIIGLFILDLSLIHI